MNPLLPVFGAAILLVGLFLASEFLVARRRKTPTGTGL